MNVSDSDIIPETQIVSETQEETQEEEEMHLLKNCCETPPEKSYGQIKTSNEEPT